MNLRPKRRTLVLAAALLLSCLLFLSTLSCANLGYYARATQGQFSLLSHRQSIAGLIYEPDLKPELRNNLTRVLRIRDYASRELHLPENGSYRSYVDVKRPYVVWNVVATPEFDLDPVQWCFPVAGCVNYRGFFSPEEAGAFAEDLRQKGNDVYLYGVNAYSTLGWFDDPVLSTFFTRSEEDLAGLIFHELSHQLVYVKNDSTFNESFAKTVEIEGVSRWLAANGEEEKIQEYLQDSRRQDEFVALVADYRQKLRGIFAKPMTDEVKRQKKGELFQELRASYGALKESWGGYKGYDRWFAELNNAKIASVSTYYTHVPAFQALLRQNKGNLAAFYLAAQKLGHLSRPSRVARLEQLRSEFKADLPPAGVQVTQRDAMKKKL